MTGTTVRIIGFVVVGQILYSGTLQYIREYGTLKAMGAKNSAVVRVILSQAMISAALGFAVGAPLAIAMRAAMRSANLSVALTPPLYAATADVPFAIIPEMSDCIRVRYSGLLA